MELADFSRRHQATRHLLQLLEPNPRLDGVAADISVEMQATAHNIASMCQDGPELTTALRHILDGKDCAVRQALLDCGKIGDTGREGSRL